MPSLIKIPFPELLYPYSPVAKPFPVPEITELCQGDQVNVIVPCALIPYILGALEVWRWEDSFIGSVEEKKNAVGVFRDMMGVFGMAVKNCGCEDEGIVLHRTNPDTGEVEISTDDGVTYETDPQSPYVQAMQVAPLKGTDSAAKRCEAANNVVDNMKDLQAKYSSYIGNLNSLTDLLAVIVVDAAAMLFLPVVGAALVAMLSPLVAKVFDTARILLGTTQEAYDLMFSEANWTTARCILYCNGHDTGKYTESDWENIKAQMIGQMGGGAQQAGANMSAMIDFWGRVGLNNAASVGAGTEGNCDDCGCSNGCLDFHIVSGTIFDVVDEHTIIYQSQIRPDGTNSVELNNATIMGGDGTCCYCAQATPNGAPITYFTIGCDGGSGFFTPQGLTVSAWAIWNYEATLFTVTVTWG